MMKKFWLIGLGGLGAFILAGMVIAGMTDSTEAVQKFDAANQLWIFRVAVYLLVIIFWLLIAPIYIVPKNHDQNKQKKGELQSKRAEVRAMSWKIALFLVVFELVAVQQSGLS